MFQNEPSGINSESQTDDDIEDLLSEYQHYLERAHNQKQIYLQKSKAKNKVPLSRYDKFIKKKNNAYKNDTSRSGYLNPSVFKFSQTKYKNPLDIFIPLHFKSRHSTKPQVISELNNYNMNLDKGIYRSNGIMDFPPPYKPLNQIKSSCCCKTDQFPCDYNCKQCLTASNDLKSVTGSSFDLLNLSDNKKYFHNLASAEGLLKSSQFNMIDRVNSIPENTLNLRIKVDISLPKTPDYYNHNMLDNTNEHNDDFSKETQSNLNIPSPYYNIPIPTDMFAYKKDYKITKPDTTSLHKMAIHKKKKSRVNNGNKRHRKKLITFHNINIDPQQFLITHDGNNDMRNRSNHINDTSVFSIVSNVTEKNEPIGITFIPNNTVRINSNLTHEEIYLTVNITKNDDKTTEDIRKNENSIENEYTTKINVNEHSGNATKRRLKRNISFKNHTAAYPVNNNESQVSKVLKTTRDIKKNDKTLLTDTVLLYWPNNHRNSTDGQSKNITAIILMRENKKAKINISNETIRRNHTEALQRAIFGEVDWNDVDTVAPTFMSFVGKYITGVLTFCSETICHSMKCVNKTCVHRVCAPEERFNNIGHCGGSQNTGK